MTVETAYNYCEQLKCGKKIKEGESYYTSEVLYMCLCERCGKRISNCFNIYDEQGVLLDKKRNMGDKGLTVIVDGNVVRQKIHREHNEKIGRVRGKK
jgi:hypothetical protein|tara:strand:- start:26545 stop:26835 length:291 start_codon:yes stop_codon:yes gene_type:complete